MKFAADNLHGLNPVVIEAFERLDAEPIKRMASQFEKAGADYIDINPGRLGRKNEDRMAFMIESVQSVSDLRLILDSPDPRLLEIGLGVIRGRPILSALSLEPEKISKILPLAKKCNAELVILLMDADSFTPPSVEEKMTLAIELRELCLEAGLGDEDLIFDPVLPNLTWHDAMSRIGEAVRTVRLLSSGAIFQEHARTMCGLSNLRSGVKRLFQTEFELVAMAALAGAGIEIVLANAMDGQVTNQIALLKQMS